MARRICYVVINKGFMGIGAATVVRFLFSINTSSMELSICFSPLNYRSVFGFIIFSLSLFNFSIINFAKRVMKL